jgi:hypothetical protein
MHHRARTSSPGGGISGAMPSLQSLLPLQKTFRLTLRPASAWPLAILLLVLLAPPAAAHGGCGHASVLEREQAAIGRSLFMNAASQAKESALQRTTAPPAATPAPPPRAPLIWLDFQLDGFEASPVDVHEITTDAMPTAVRVLQKLLKVREGGCGAWLLTFYALGRRILEERGTVEQS